MTTYELSRCVVCHGADADEIAGPEDVRAEAEILWAFHMRRLSPRTPPERLLDRVAFSQPPPWRLVRCRECGLVYRNPVERREELLATYAGDAPSFETMSALYGTQQHAYRAQVRRLCRYLARRGTGLEVGSYVGAFLAAARRAHWSFVGLDVNPVVNAFARSRGFIVHDGDLEHFRAERPFDAVAIWNTFDQVSDPRAVARAAAALLRPGGIIAVRVPNGACYAAWRPRLAHRARAIRGVAAALLAHNNLLTFPYRFGFSPVCLTRLLRDVGFDVRRVVGDVLVPTADEWTRRWAVLEERAFRPLTRPWKPWFEVYARKVGR